MKTVGTAITNFRVSEFDPSQTDWGHTGYVSVDPQEPLSIDEKMDLHIFFTPRKGTTFEEIEELVKTLDRTLEKVTFNIIPKSHFGH